MSFIQRLKETRDSLARKEHDIALACCPYFLGQIVWHHIGKTDTRVECIVSRISFKETPPYYSLFLSQKLNSGIWSKQPKRISELHTVVGVTDYYQENPEAYLARLQKLIQDGIIHNIESGTSVDTEHIVARCQAAKLGEELTTLRPELRAMVEKAFSRSRR